MIEGQFEKVKKKKEYQQMRAKLKETKNFIKCWVDAWGVDGVYISYSGGKDSEVLLDIARSMYPGLKGVFCNTGLELPEVKSQVREHENIDWLIPTMSFKKIIEIYGWPVISKEQAQFIYHWRNTKSEKLRYTLWNGNRHKMGKISEKWKFIATDAPFKVSHICCNKLKKRPAINYENLTGRKPMIGNLASESALRAIQKDKCNVYDSKRPISKPLSAWNETDIWTYIKTYKVSYSKAYDMGWERTGCIFCLFGVQHQEVNKFQILKETHPKLYKYVIHKLGAKEILDFMGIPY